MTKPKDQELRRLREALGFEAANVDRMMWLMERIRDDINMTLEDLGRYRRKRNARINKLDEETLRSVRESDDSDLA